MELESYRDFTRRLQGLLEEDDRVIGLIALGSMAEGSRMPDAWSDHDFFVVTEPGKQPQFRHDLSWLPDHESIVLRIHETAHGLKVLYESGHLLEFAVFDRDDLADLKVNDYRVLIDRDHLTPIFAAAARRQPEARSYDPLRDAAMVVALVYVGYGRFARGEHLSAHVFLKHHLLHHLIPLLRHLYPPQNPALVDDLDAMRRVEIVLPDHAPAINAVMLLPPPEAAVRLLDLLDCHVKPHLEGYPAQAVAVVRRYITG